MGIISACSDKNKTTTMFFSQKNVSSYAFWLCIESIVVPTIKPITLWVDKISISYFNLLRILPKVACYIIPFYYIIVC